MDPILKQLGFKSPEHVQAACIWHKDFVAGELAMTLRRRIRDSFRDDGIDLGLMLGTLPLEIQAKARAYAEYYERIVNKE